MEGVPALRIRKGRKVTANLAVVEDKVLPEVAVVEQEGEPGVVVRTKLCRAILCGLLNVSDAGILGNRAKSVLAAV